jgi:hypothetical protein
MIIVQPPIGSNMNLLDRGTPKDVIIDPGLCPAELVSVREVAVEQTFNAIIKIRTPQVVE